MPRHFQKITLLAAAALVLMLSGCVTSQDLYPYDQRIYQLEQRYKELEKQQTVERNQIVADVNTKEQDLRDQSAAMSAALDALRDELSNLRGQLEESDFKLQQQLEGVNKEGRQMGSLADHLAYFDRRLSHLENYLGLQEAAAEEQPAGRSAPAPPPSGDPATQLYDAGKQAFDGGDYVKARQRFEQLIQQYPKSEMADNAQFWVAEIFYREKWYEKAILEYQKVIENYPDGNKVPAALLKQAQSFSNIADRSNARLIYQELVNKYPQSSESQVARQKLLEY